MATCKSCSAYARLEDLPEPEFKASEINPATGLCWSVCDMEAELSDIQRAEYESLMDEYA